MNLARVAACVTLLLFAQIGFASFRASAELGNIRGRVHYPACFAPEDLTICAESSDGRVRCTQPTIDDIEITYQLEVPAGRWVVYALTDSTLPGRRGWFSRAVKCGLSVECEDHTPIVVEVKSGQTVRGVDPDDWFGPQERDVPRA
jgi:hypothetical protein